MDSPDPRARLALWATVSPSEDPAKVAGALVKAAGRGAGKVSFGRGGAAMEARPEALPHVRDQLRDRRIRSAARRQLLGNVERTSTSMMLNRQAAAAGVFAICGSPEESPLGPIYLKIESEKLAEVIDWLTSYEAG